jgi:hypothetical protein
MAGRFEVEGDLRGTRGFPAAGDEGEVADTAAEESDRRWPLKGRPVGVVCDERCCDQPAT